MTEKRAAIVTGGSLGIGLATVQAFAARGIRVVALARNLGRLEEAIAGIDGAVGIAADVSQEADVVGVGAPVAKRIVDPAAREGPGEDLAADAVQAGVAAVEERRVGRDGEQGRKQLAQPVADGDGAIGPADADVDVQAPGVVSLSHPAEVVLQAAVVLGVDDPLVQVVGPGVGAGRGERQPLRLDQPEQGLAPPALALGGLGEGLAAP